MCEMDKFCFFVYMMVTYLTPTVAVRGIFVTAAYNIWLAASGDMYLRRVMVWDIVLGFWTRILLGGERKKTETTND